MKIEDYNEYYIQGSDHYLIPNDEFKELFNEMVNWREESKKQKEVIDKAIDKLYSIPIETTRQEVIDIARETVHILKEVS